MANYSELKKGGFIPQRQDGFFSLRIKVTGGKLTGAQLEALSRLAETYGRDEVHLTSRQGVEIPFIRLEAIEAIKQELESGGLAPASLKPGIRTITACPGSYFCRYGLTDPQAMAAILEENLEGRDLPHKFKIGLTGCHNNCLKTEENDIGLKGGLFPVWTAPDRCTFCGLCQKVCPTGAIIVEEEELSFHSSQCVQCGRCYNKCPQKCWNGRGGWRLTFGGMFGNEIRLGRSLMSMRVNENEILSIMNRALEYYRQNGHKGERFARTLDRLGWENFKNFMIG